MAKNTALNQYIIDRRRELDQLLADARKDVSSCLEELRNAKREARDLDKAYSQALSNPDSSAEEVKTIFLKMQMACQEVRGCEHDLMEARAYLDEVKADVSWEKREMRKLR